MFLRFNQCFRLAGCLCLAGVLSPAAAQQPLKIAITSTAPLFATMNEQGQLVGFNVDLVRELCKRLARECELVTTRFPDVVPAVASGEADIGVANLLRTPEREREVAFSVSYWRSTSSYVGKPGTTIPSPTQPLAHRLCAIDGSRQLAFAQKLPRTGGGDVSIRRGNADLLAGLKGGQCQLALAPMMQILPFLQSAAGAGLGFLGAPMSDEGLGGDVHLVVPSDALSLREQVDDALRGIMRDGTHDRLSRRYFPFSIL